MTNDAGLTAEPGSDDAFEVHMRGYSRRQVDAFAAESRSQIRDLKQQLSRSHGETERLRQELSAARQALSTTPAHEQVSERVGQILKLAGDEAKAQRARAQDEIGKQRDEAQKEADRFRADAREQAEHMLTAAREQAENALATAQAEADEIRNAARADSDRAVNEATKEAESTLAPAKAQAKQMLDEATMRASAIHDGAERRLNLLTSRHTHAMRHLSEIRDAVTNLVASDTAGGPLADEVAKPAATSLAAGGVGAAAPSPRTAASAAKRRPAPAPPGGRGAEPEASAGREIGRPAQPAGSRAGPDDQAGPSTPAQDHASAVPKSAQTTPGGTSEP